MKPLAVSIFKENYYNFHTDSHTAKLLIFSIENYFLKEKKIEWIWGDGHSTVNK